MRSRFFFVLAALIFLIPVKMMVGSLPKQVGTLESTGTFHIFLILAIDQSGSMSTNDEQGSRFDAAKFLIGALDQGDEVAAFTFAAQTTAITADSPPKVIEGSDDKLALWRTIDAMRFDRSQQSTNLLELFTTLDKYINKISPRAQTQTLLVILTDGQDYVDESCRSGTSAAEAAKCSQHRQQALSKGQSVRQTGLKQYQDDQLGKSFTFLPIALKGPTADYDLDFLASVSGLAKEDIPQASSKDLVETFKNQVIGRMLDRVAISGVETERRGIFSFKIPEGARSLTFATTGTKTQSGQTLPIWHPTSDRSVSAPASCNEVEGGCLAVVPDPSAGDWWVEEQGGGVPPQAFLRFDLNLVVTPAILPAGKPVSATVDLQDRTSGRSLLGTGYWEMAPLSVSAADTATFAVKEKPQGLSVSKPIAISKGDARFTWSTQVLVWPALVDRSSLEPLGEEYRLATGDTIPLAVMVQTPPDPKFQMGDIVAHVEVGSQSQDLTLRPDGHGRYSAELDALPMLGQGDEGTLRVSYEVRGASYQGFTYPPDWWRVQEQNSPSIVRVRNRVTVDPGIVDYGWLRSREAKTKLQVTLRCDQCEQGTQIPLKLEVAQWQAPGNTSLAIPPLVQQLSEPLKPGEQREVTLDLSSILSRLPEVNATGYGSFSVTGGRVPVDIKPSQFAIHVDNRPELLRLWQDDKLRLFGLGLLGTGWAFYGWDAQYLWAVVPVLLCVLLIGWTLSLFARHRGWLAWAPLALLGGGGGLLVALTAVRLVRGVPHFSYNLEWGTGEDLPELIRLGGAAPRDFTLSNDPSAQFYHTLPADSSLVYVQLSQEGEVVNLVGLRGTRVCEEGGAPTPEKVRMLPGRRYFLLSSGVESVTDDSLWLRLAAEEVTASDESAGMDPFSDFGNF